MKIWARLHRGMDYIGVYGMKIWARIHRGIIIQVNRDGHL